MKSDEAVQALKKEKKTALHENKDAFDMAIEALERTGWVPISQEMPDEKLPEGYQRVLVTVTNYFGKKVVRVAEYIDFIKSFRIKENNDRWKVGEKELLAWMPLPDPYKWKEDLDKLNERYKAWQEAE